MKSDTKIGIFVVLLLVGVVVVLLGREVMNRKKAAQQPPEAAALEGTDETLTPPPADAAKGAVDGTKDQLAGAPAPAPALPGTPAPAAQDPMTFDPSKPLTGLEAPPVAQVPLPAPGLPVAPPEAPVAVAENTPREYVVKPGDLLEGISRQFYGKRSQWKLIAEANPGINPNNLKVGSTLQIPPAPAASAPAPGDPAVADAAPSAGRTYKVKAGDTLGGIARRVYGRESRWTLIAEANPGVNPKALKVGAVLTLPEAGSAVPPASERPERAKPAKAPSKEPWKVKGATRLVTPTRG